MYQFIRLVPQLPHNGLLLAPIWAKNQSKSAVTIFADFRTSFSRNIFRKIIFCISRNFAKLATLVYFKQKWRNRRRKSRFYQVKESVNDLDLLTSISVEISIYWPNFWRNLRSLVILCSCHWWIFDFQKMMPKCANFSWNWHTKALQNYMVSLILMLYF